MKVLEYCWSCGKEHDHSKRNPLEYGVLCECGGWVVSPSGKVQMKLVAETKEEEEMLRRVI